MTLHHAARPLPDVPWQEVVDPAGVAERLAVQHTTVHRWQARRLLPEPAYHLGQTPWWWLDDIEAWARSTGRLAE